MRKDQLEAQAGDLSEQVTEPRLYELPVKQTCVRKEQQMTQLVMQALCLSEQELALVDVLRGCLMILAGMAGRLHVQN